MAIERLGIELGEDVDLVDLAVYAVAHRDVDEPVASPDGHRGLGPCTREREEARAGATAEDDGGHGVRADVPPRSRSRRRLGARVRLLLLDPPGGVGEYAGGGGGDGGGRHRAAPGRGRGAARGERRREAGEEGRARVRRRGVRHRPCSRGTYGVAARRWSLEETARRQGSRESLSLSLAVGLQLGVL